jgi:phosphocarrier protein HPr
MRTIDLTVRNPSGIHLRPAAVFVKAAAGFKSRVTLENLDRGAKPVDAKSSIMVMNAHVTKGTQIRVAAEGPDEEEAIAALAALVESGLGETVEA